MFFKSIVLGIAVLTNVGFWRCNAQECGHAPLGNRIVGGTAAPEGAWPWQVDIQKDGKHICGGSIITKDWVLSAAHCFKKPIVESAFVLYLGRHFQNGVNQHEERRLVQRVVVMPGYTSAMNGRDVALVQLNSPVQWTDHIQPICLPDHNVQFPGGTQCYVTGWGNIELNKPLPAPGPLQQMEVPIVSQDTCYSMHQQVVPEYRVNILSDMICAGFQEGGKDPCKGDSGVPLMCPKNKKWVQAGLASMTSCGSPNLPAVYSRLTEYTSFIKENVPEVQLYSRGSPSQAGSGAAVMLTCVSMAMLLLAH